MPDEYSLELSGTVKKETIEIATSVEFELELCKILGIEPDKTASIHISILPSMPIVITVESFATIEESEKLLDAFRKQIE